jgi:beta-lactam-binding protein with PASTA domain
VAGCRFNATGIMLVAMLLVGCLSACGGLTSTASSGSATAPSSTGTSNDGLRTTATSNDRLHSTATSNDALRSSSTANTTAATASAVVPMVDGDPVSIAELYIKQAGLQFGAELQEPNVSVPSGRVITTSPYVGEKVPYGYTVTLLVSTGSAACEQVAGANCPLYSRPMPNILGQTLEQAKTTLALIGITLGQYIFQASSAAEGTVICADHAPGESVRQTDAVKIGISSGNTESPPITLCGVSASQQQSASSQQQSSASSQQSSASAQQTSASPSPQTSASSSP